MPKMMRFKLNNIKDKWFRGLYMIVFLISGWIALMLAIVIMAFQFLSSLITGKCNNNLLKFAKTLSNYISEVLLFLTYNTEEKPYPFGIWSGEVRRAAVAVHARARPRHKK